MTYPNAWRGVKNICLAELIGLVANAASILVLILLTAIPALETSGFLVALALVALLLELPVLVLMTVGIFQALPDEAIFKQARLMILITLGLTFLSLGTTSGSPFHTVLELLGDAVSLLCVLYILKGILNLARQLKDRDMMRRGSSLYGLILVAGVLGILLSVVAAVLPKDPENSSFASMLPTILVLAVTALESVLLYLYFRRAVVMLREESPQAPEGQAAKPTADRPRNARPRNDKSRNDKPKNDKKRSRISKTGGQQ